MDKNGVCLHCKKNPATVSRKDPATGAEVKEYYCQACYQRLFLTRDFFEEKNLVVEINGEKCCAFCKRTKREIFATGLVGCANCYKAFAKDIYPTILKLQGDKAHCGRNPTQNPEYPLREIGRFSKDEKET